MSNHLSDKISLDINNLVTKNGFTFNHNRWELEELKNALVEHPIDVCGWRREHFYIKHVNGEYVHILLLYTVRLKEDNFKIFIGKNLMTYLGKYPAHNVMFEHKYNGVKLIHALEHAIMTSLHIVDLNTRPHVDRSLKTKLINIVNKVTSMFKK